MNVFRSPFFDWETPNGPDLPFSTGILVFDLMRIVVVTMCFGIGMMSVIAAIRPNGTLGQKARMLGTGIIFVLTLATGTITHIGDYGHWRLVASFFASMLVSWGLWSYYRYEKPSEVKPYEGPLA